jgi:PPM family protein phosphatase
MHFDIAIRVEAAGPIGDDRAAAFSRTGGHLLVLADGAGGTSGGTAAADAVVGHAGTFNPTSSWDCVRLLERLDQELTTVGQTTAILLALFETGVFGASVGDSAAWLVRSGEVVDLTAGQVPKPLLGSGRARPIAFGPHDSGGRVVIGSDGLFKYVSFDRIRSISCTSPLAAVPDDLIAAARLPSGGLQDDIAVIVAGPEAY